jgi:hypothetical protein
MLKSAGVNICGKHAVVVGRSNIVGKPQALLLLNENATVSICHSRTADLGSITRQGDILVVAVGRAQLIKKDMVKPGAIVIDVLESPDYYHRRIWYNWGSQDYNTQPYQEWCARNRMAQGFLLNSGHSYGEMIGQNKAAFDAHPEYYALVGGKRVVNGESKMCLSNPGLRKVLVDYAVRKVKANPTIDSISADPSDGGGWCECEECPECCRYIIIRDNK